jgi:Sulfotransferase family
MTNFPVFILGSPRSGTSTLHFVLKTAFGFEGDTEGHVTNLLYKLMMTIGEHFSDYGGFGPKGSSTLSNLGKDSIINSVASTLLSNRGSLWCDKTPGADAIRCAPYVSAMMPQARFIHIIRNGLDNVASRMNKFPGVPFNTHCAQWAEDAGSWLAARKVLSPSSFLELSFDDLRSPPDMLIQKLEDFLQTPGERAFDGELPWIEAGASYNGSTFWSRARYEIFNTICFDVMSEYGFKFENQAVDSKGTIHLRPPFVTGDDTQIICDNNEFVFCEPSVSGVWVMIHPNEPARRPTQLVYRNVCLYGHNKFNAKIKLDGQGSRPVTFRLRILRSNGTSRLPPRHTHDRSAVCDDTVNLNCGEQKEWNARFPDSFIVCDVEISSTMTNPADSNDCAWAKILKPRLMLEDR